MALEKSDQVKEVRHKKLHVIYIKSPGQVDLQKQRVDVREGRMNVAFLWEETIHNCNVDNGRRLSPALR